MTQQSLPEPLAEAARDLLLVCSALNEPTPAEQALQSHDQTKATLTGWAYSAVAEALELAASVQHDPHRYGLGAGGADAPAGRARPRNGDRPVEPSLRKPRPRSQERAEPLAGARQAQLRTGIAGKILLSSDRNQEGFILQSRKDASQRTGFLEKL